MKNLRDQDDVFFDEEEEAPMLPTDIQGISVDYQKIFKKALTLFTDQASSDEKVDLSQIELTRAKANSFLEGLSNIVSVQHEIDIISAEKARFKRTDELRILNNLRQQCEAHSEVGKKMMEIILVRMNDMQEQMAQGLPIEVEDLSLLQNLLEQNIDSTNKVIVSTSRIIQLERFSGSRPWGSRGSGASKSIGAVKYLSDLEKGKVDFDEEAEKKRKRRRLSAEELDKIGYDLTKT